MSKEIAFKGNRERSVDIIAILKMLGGCESGYNVITEPYYYYIEFGNITGTSQLDEHKKWRVYTIEEFEFKYPYKTGDKVWVDFLHEPQIIKYMKWNGEEIVYAITGSNQRVYCNELKKYIPETNVVEIQESETVKKPKTQIEIDTWFKHNAIKNATQLLDVEKILNEDNLVLPDTVTISKNGISSIEFIKWYEKINYPETIEQCFEIMNLNTSNTLIFENKVYNKHDITAEIQLYRLYQLMVCRNAYWKICGDWKPDWNKINDKYCIYRVSEKLWLENCQTRHCFLAFPTIESRDKFYIHFEELINLCKDFV